MRFKQYLYEEKYQNLSTVSEDTVKDWIKKHASQYVQKLKDGRATPIFRGFKPDSDFMIGDSTTINRRAANTSNYTNLLVSNSTEWKQFPPRSASYICSTDENVADSYGTIALMIPADNARIGVCSASDFWDSFKFLSQQFNNVNGLNSVLGFLNREMKLGLNDEEMSFDEMKKALSAVSRENLFNLIDLLRHTEKIQMTTIMNMIR